ncbi:hypothetical protein CEXT_325811 [Caerostris extrusa]|uniref:Uncharacterized protein n=1 Tax=Caerostris extrusa TaxID=172846 RepID=A0AAV4SDZ0_CAEEX|nr:hypothetical protein CEXT_325811 [Caerostris extrusa]
MLNCTGKKSPGNRVRSSPSSAPLKSASNEITHNSLSLLLPRFLCLPGCHVESLLLFTARSIMLCIDLNGMEDGGIYRNNELIFGLKKDYFCNRSSKISAYIISFDG